MKKTAIVLACICLLGTAKAQATPFRNGSFEFGANPGSFTTLYDGDSSSISGWVVGTSSFQDGTSGSIDYIGSYWQPNRLLNFN